MGRIQQGKRSLEERGYGDVLKEIERRLESANHNYQFFNEGEIDLEVILPILNANTDHTNALKEVGPFAIYLSTFADIKKLSLQRIKTEDLMKIRNTIGNVITNSLIKYKKDRAKKYPTKIYFKSQDLNHRYKTKTNHTTQPALFGHIVTTNYDRVIENLYEDNDIHGRPPCIGLVEDVKTQERYLDTEGIVSGKYQAVNTYIEYLKLHGSIDWRIRSSDKRIVQREHTKSLRGEKYPEQLMIYPVYEKHISRDPYFALHYYFRYLLHINDVYLVIGFSFRDPSINNAFRDALINKATSRMIIVNSNRKAIRKRVDEIFPKKK